MAVDDKRVDERCVSVFFQLPLPRNPLLAAIIIYYFHKSPTGFSSLWTFSTVFSTIVFISFWTSSMDCAALTMYHGI